MCMAERVVDRTVDSMAQVMKKTSAKPLKKRLKNWHVFQYQGN